MTILFLGLVWPEPTSSAAGWRILHLIRLFSNAYQVHFASAAMKSEFSFDLASEGVIEHRIVLNDATFDDFVKELSPDVVVFDRFMVEEQYGWRVAESCPNALRILDTEDLHFLRIARQEAFKKKSEIDLQSVTAKREVSSILRSDLSLIISEKEMELLINTFQVPKERLFYIPFQEEKLENEERQSFEERQNFVFIGNFIHEPNWRTVEVLKREVWPQLRKALPEAELHIFGAYPSEKVFQLHHEKEHFLIKGRADHARDTLEKYRVLLAPIPFGAGTKGKFVDAMYSGTPTVSSSLGAEAMSIDGKWNGFLEDDLVSFTAKAKQLYSDKSLWEESQQIGFDLFNASFADNSYSEKLMHWVEENILAVESCRKSNFIGQILMQNQFNATKYMSLWIEEKNKRKL